MPSTPPKRQSPAERPHGQQTTRLAAEGAPVDPNTTYLMKTAEHIIWPYDEYDESFREIIPLDPADVLTVEQSGTLLAPLIKPLPAYNPFTA